MVTKIKCVCGKEFNSYKYYCPECGVSKYAEDLNITEPIEVLITSISEIITDAENLVMETGTGRADLTSEINITTGVSAPVKSAKQTKSKTKSV